MIIDTVIGAYNEAIFDTDKKAAFEAVNTGLALGLSAEEIVFQVVIPSTEWWMAAITKDPDANLAQHFMTAQIAGEVTERMLALFVKPPKIIGKVVIGTAHGDLHSLGKRIVMGCLKSMMVEAVDLGVNVPPERFVEEAIRHDALVIAISAMMVHTATGEKGCRGVRAILREKGLEDRFRIVVGGAPFRFDEGLYRTVGADDWSADGLAGSRLITELILKGMT
jgi:methanogenic corrinoid protein MtbC1